MPSRASSVAKARPNCALSYSRPSSIAHSPPTWMASRMPRIASGALPASVAASSMVCDSSSAAGTTRLTRPSASARAASTGAPVSVISSAAARPARRSRRWLPPKPGSRPSVTSGRPSFALSAAMRRWQHIASSRPPPSAKPLTIATTGLGMRSMRRIRRWPTSEKSRAWTGLRPDISAMSAPATKAFAPAPVSTTARTASSAAAASKAACRASSVARFSAFSLSGRLTVTTRTAPWSAMRTGSGMGSLVFGPGAELPRAGGVGGYGVSGG